MILGPSNEAKRGIFGQILSEFALFSVLAEAEARRISTSWRAARI
jgi:hypothetical protein